MSGYSSTAIVRCVCVLLYSVGLVPMKRFKVQSTDLYRTGKDSLIQANSYDQVVITTTFFSVNKTLFIRSRTYKPHIRLPCRFLAFVIKFSAHTPQPRIPQLNKRPRNDFLLFTVGQLRRMHFHLGNLFYE